MVKPNHPGSILLVLAALCLSETAHVQEIQEGEVHRHGGTAGGWGTVLIRAAELGDRWWPIGSAVTLPVGLDITLTYQPGPISTSRAAVFWEGARPRSGSSTGFQADLSLDTPGEHVVTLRVEREPDEDLPVRADTRRFLFKVLDVHSREVGVEIDYPGDSHGSPVDLNGDLRINRDDLDFFWRSYGAARPENGYSSAADWDGSGTVGLEDLVRFIDAYDGREGEDTGPSWGNGLIYPLSGKHHPYAFAIPAPVFRAVTDPPGLEQWIEWEVNGDRIATGPVFTQPFGLPGFFDVSAACVFSRERSKSQRRLTVYEAAITNFVSEHDVLEDGKEYVFQASTSPPGFEDYVTWRAETKYGHAVPEHGRGSSFRIAFRESWAPDGSFQWFGVQADNAYFNQDQKPQTQADLSAVNGLTDIFPLDGPSAFACGAGPEGSVGHEVSIPEGCPECPPKANTGDGDGDGMADDRQLDLNGAADGLQQDAANGKLELWCVDQGKDAGGNATGYYALVWVPTGQAGRFIGKCPFKGGKNGGWKWIDPKTGRILKTSWRSQDGGGDDDGDGKLDRWHYEYDAGGNMVTEEHYEDGAPQGDGRGPAAPRPRPFTFGDLLPRNPDNDDPTVPKPNAPVIIEPMTGDPPLVALATDVTVQIFTVLASEGPLSSVSANWSVQVVAPSGCTVNGSSSITLNHTSTVSSASVSQVPDSFTIRCAAPGIHVFTMTTSIQPADGEISDPQPDDDVSLMTLTVRAGSSEAHEER